MPAADPITQSRRVMATISMIVRTPCPASPTSHPTVSSNSGSLLALLRLPSLSLSRWMRNGLREPSGSTRGTRKHDSPSGAWASTRNTSHMGALVNHLCPRSRYVAQGRDDRVRHRERAAVAGLHLTPGVKAGRAGHVGAGALVGPRRTGQA